jgi:hypothetical protein
MANVFASTDQGKTWTRRGGVAFPGTDFDEHMIAERQDGSLRMLARTKGGIRESVSTDQGATWSEPAPSSIANLSARFFIRRLASGKLLLVKNGPINVRLPRRANLKAFLSDATARRGAKVCSSMTVRRCRIPMASRRPTARSPSSMIGTATATQILARE